MAETGLHVPNRGRVIFSTAKTNRERVRARLSGIEQTRYWSSRFEECEGPSGRLVFELYFIHRTDDRKRVLPDAVKKVWRAVDKLAVYDLTGWLLPFDA